MLWAAPIGAQTTQLGQLPSAGPELACAPGYNLAQVTVGSGPSYQVPSPGGTITSWQHRGYEGFGYGAGSGRLQVWRSAGGQSLTLVGQSNLETFAAGQVQTFPAQIQVNPGDVLGLRIEDASLGCVFDVGGPHQIYSQGAGAPNPPTGTTIAFTQGADGLLNVSATLEDPLELGGSKKQSSAKAVKVEVTCLIACSATGEGTVTIPSAGEPAKVAVAGRAKLKSALKPDSAEVPAGQTATLKLKLKGKASKQLKRALKSGKKAKAKVTVTVTAGGTVTSEDRKITIQ